MNKDEQIRISREALEFYANYSSWGKGSVDAYNDAITVLDCEECDTAFNDGFIGGKIAREALKKLEEMEKDNEN